MAVGLSLDHWPTLKTADNPEPIPRTSQHRFDLAVGARPPSAPDAWQPEAPPSPYRPAAAPSAIRPDALPSIGPTPEPSLDSETPSPPTPLHALADHPIEDDLALWLASIPELETEEETIAIALPAPPPPTTPPPEPIPLSPPAPASIPAMPETAPLPEPPAPVQPHTQPKETPPGPAAPPAQPEVAQEYEPDLTLHIDIQNLAGPPVHLFAPTYGDLLQISVTVANESGTDASDLLIQLSSKGPIQFDADSAILSAGLYGLGYWDLPHLRGGEEGALSLLALVEPDPMAPVPDNEVDISVRLIAFEPATANPVENPRHIADSRFAVHPRQSQQELPGFDACDIRGAVFVDLNGNGLRDEPLAAAGLNGVRIDLYAAESTPIWLDSTLTATSPDGEMGLYAFTDLPAGIYLVRIDTGSLPEHGRRLTTLAEIVVSCPLAPDELGVPPDFGLRFEPTAIELASFNAHDDGISVRLHWSTAMEIEHLGFHLYRAENEQAPRRRINPHLILATGLGDGADYEFDDIGAEPGVSWLYWIEDIDWSFRSTLHGPFSTRP